MGFITDATALPLQYVDENFRSQAIGEPGLNDLDNPFPNSYVARGEESIQRATEQVADELVERLMKAQSTTMKKFYYYPESLGSINDKSYSEGHEVPRHILKISILDYAGGNLISKETKQTIGDVGSGMDLWHPIDSVNKLTDQVGTASRSFIDNDSKRFVQSEIYNYQERANAISSSNFDPSKMIDAAQKETSLQSQRDAYKSKINQILNGPSGKQTIINYLTSVSDAQRSDIKDQILSATKINSQMLPDEVKAMIYLYAGADNLNYTYSTNWSAKEQTGSLPNIQNVLANAIDGKGSLTKDAASLAGSIALRTSGDTAIGKMVAAKSGMAPAQNYEYLFDSVGRRNFGVNVTFYPKSQDEIRQAAQIISAFKHYSHPSRPNREALVTVPCTFLLQNMTYVDGKGWCENLYLPKYKICALLNTTTNYAAGGTLITHQQFVDVTSGPTFKAPVKITLSLNFQEMHILTREDIPEPQNFFSAIQNGGYY